MREWIFEDYPVRLLWVMWCFFAFCLGVHRGWTATGEAIKNKKQRKRDALPPTHWTPGLIGRVRRHD